MTPTDLNPERHDSVTSKTASLVKAIKPYFRPFSALSAGRVSIYLLLLLSLTGCQPAEPPSPTAPPVSPTILLIPPIPTGDGSDVMDKLLERGILRVGIQVWPSAEYSPPAFRGAANAITGGALTGFEVDIARLLAEGLSLELELVEAYPPVISRGDWRGNWDIALAMLAPFDQPAEPGGVSLTYSRPYGRMPLGVVVPAAAAEITSLEQLADHTVGVLEDSATQRLLTAELPLTIDNSPLLPHRPARLQIVPLSNLAKDIQRLALEPGNVPFEAIFGPAPILQQALKSDLPLKVSASAAVFGEQPLAVAVVSQDGLKVERLVSEINKILARADRQGILAEIYLHWYEQDFSPGQP